MHQAYREKNDGWSQYRRLPRRMLSFAAANTGHEKWREYGCYGHYFAGRRRRESSLRPALTNARCDFEEAEHFSLAAGSISLATARFISRATTTAANFWA